jgi:hypothetical protein
MADEMEAPPFDGLRERDEVPQKIVHDVLALRRRRIAEAAQIDAHGTISGARDGLDLRLPLLSRVPNAVHEEDGGPFAEGIPSEPSAVVSREKVRHEE